MRLCGDPGCAPPEDVFTCDTCELEYVFGPAQDRYCTPSGKHVCEGCLLGLPVGALPDWVWMEETV